MQKSINNSRWKKPLPFAYCAKNPSATLFLYRKVGGNSSKWLLGKKGEIQT